MSTITPDEMKRRIKDAVRSVDPTAEVILFGSRARGDATADSDWDVLILVDNIQNNRVPDDPYRRVLFDISLETATFIQPVIRNKTAWKTRHRITPLFQSIKEEGIRL